MAVRVRLRVRGRTGQAELPALVNSGFEADEPQLILPVEVAQELGLLGEARMLEAFEVAGGGRALGYRITRPVEVELVLEDREPIRVEALVTVMPGEEEAVMSDFLSSELGIVILDARRGLWCLRDEIGRKERRSYGS
mgnify:CR=1 FL=1